MSSRQAYFVSINSSFTAFDGKKKPKTFSESLYLKKDDNDKHIHGTYKRKLNNQKEKVVPIKNEQNLKNLFKQLQTYEKKDKSLKKTTEGDTSRKVQTNSKTVQKTTKEKLQKNNREKVPKNNHRKVRVT